MAVLKLPRYAQKTIACLVMVVSFGVPTYFAVCLLACRIPGAQPPPPMFMYDQAFDIEKTGAGGIKYTVNNSIATFDLDVAPADAHTGKLFKDYASAMKYCESAGLPLLPSVQLVQGKCKQFDDGLCATLELAVQRGLDPQRAIGKQEALTRLASRLVELLGKAAAEQRPPVERALIYVAAALQLGGAPPTLPPDIAGKVDEAKESFLSDPACSRPIGFWTWSDDLGKLFMQDRFLADGPSLQEEAGACTVLALAVAREPEIARTFRRSQAFDAKLTNPLVYVETEKVPAPQAAHVSFDALSATLGADRSIPELLEPDAIAKARAELIGRFGEGAGFALVAYSASKEYDLLLRLTQEGRFTGSEATMELIIEAVKSGRLSLEPGPNSGWYDYQWHALETLILPERARESVKLKLTDAYKQRLKNAFKTILTKQRETHIKHLPVIMLGEASGQIKPPRKVEIGPEFSAEPTATVYLRLARGYRFLRNALHAVLGEDALKRLHRRNADLPAVEADLDAELRESALRLYGLYEVLCLEIGQRPEYLEGEISPEDIEQAKAIAARWRMSLAEDRDLAADTRVAVPISRWPGGPTRFWGTGGVRLERLTYKYREKPGVGGYVEPVFVPTYYYAPSDIFLEFDRPGEAPLTRAEFRAICERCADEHSLRAALGAIGGSSPGRGYNWLLAVALAALLAGALLAYRFRARLPRIEFRRFLTRRNVAIAGVSLGVVLVGWILALVLFPSYRVRFLVKYVAPLNTNLGALCENWFVPGVHRRYRMKALVSLLDDPDPQVRYLAARFLETTSWSDDGSDEDFPAEPEMQAKLRAAADDDILEVAASAIWQLAAFKNQANVEFLIEKLKAKKHVDALCTSAIFALGQIADPRALEHVLPFTRDPRRVVRYRAIGSLGAYDDARAVDRLIELLRSADEPTSRCPFNAIQTARMRLSDAWRAQRFDEALLAAAQNTGFSPQHRTRAAEAIAGAATRAKALLSMLVSPSSDKYTTISVCRSRAAFSLGKLGPEGSIAVPALREALQDPDPKVTEAAAEALKEIEPR